MKNGMYIRDEINNFETRRYLMSKNNKIIATAFKQHGEIKFSIRCVINQPKCSKEIAPRLHIVKVLNPSPFEMFKALKEGRNEMKKLCATELIAFHQTRINSIISLL